MTDSARQLPIAPSSTAFRDRSGMKGRAEMLGGVRIPYNESVAALRSRVRGPGPGRWAAFVALGHSAEPDAVSVLLEATTAADWSARRAACDALGLRSRASVVADRVAELLRDPVPLVAQAACGAIALIGGPEHRHEVMELLQHRNVATRITAVRTLDKLCWEPTHRRIFLSLASDHPSADVRAAADEILGRRTGSGARGPNSNAGSRVPNGNSRSSRETYARPAYGVARMG